MKKLILMDNARGSFENRTDEQPEAFVTINTIDQTVFVERLPKPEAISRGRNDVLSYGTDNLYPNKVKAMAQRSQSTHSAIGTLTRFSVGQGFAEIGGADINKLVVNSEGQTLFDILDHAGNEKASLGVAIHFNYNIFGEIMEVQEIPFETLRWDKEGKRLVFCADWSRSSHFSNNKKIHYYPFNPESVLEEINETGLDNYPGQVLYWIPKNKEIYPLARFDPALDDTQFEHEAGVAKLRNIQNGYSAGYIGFYPAAIESALEKQGVINDHNAGKGAKNTGKTKMIPLNASAMEALGTRKMIEEIPRTGIDKLFTKQNEETKSNIYAVFNQPPILNGIATQGMFNQESFLDAFDFYNSITEKDRQGLERIFNSFLPYTIWGVEGVEIIPLDFISKRTQANVVVEDAVIEDDEDTKQKPDEEVKE